MFLRSKAECMCYIFDKQFLNQRQAHLNFIAMKKVIHVSLEGSERDFLAGSKVIGPARLVPDAAAHEQTDGNTTGYLL